MPRSTEVTTAGNSLPAMPDHIRQELLAAQSGEIGTAPKLPRVSVMPAAAGLFEFKDTNDTVREFEGVILGSHPRNVLWDKPYGSQPEGAEMEGPGCSSRDGQVGVPREGFRHEALGDAASGQERIGCGRCPYNQWESKHLVDSRGGKGKACTNQRVLYIAVQGRALPVELVLPPTSMVAFDEYLTTLLNQGIPSQAIVTKFAQERKERGGIRWAQVTFTRGAFLAADEFEQVMSRRRAFDSTIRPQAGAVDVVAEVAAVASVDERPAAAPTQLPF